jgi:hypothetical protein
MFTELVRGLCKVSKWHGAVRSTLYLFSIIICVVFFLVCFALRSIFVLYLCICAVSVIGFITGDPAS